MKDLVKVLSSILVFFALLYLAVTFVCCGGESKCYSDNCEVNKSCVTLESKECSGFPSPPGRFVEGSMMTMCTIWNDSKTGIPKEVRRENPACVSGWERAVKCNEVDTKWVMLCE